MKLGYITGAALAILLAACAVAPAKAMDVKDAGTAAGGIVDDGDAGWTWSGFVEYDDQNLHGGTAHAGGPGSYAVYTFTGTAVDVYVMTGPSVNIGGRNHRLGGMEVSIDGHLKGDEPTCKPAADYDVEAFSATGLSSGIHVLKIDPDDGWVVVDYIRIHNGDADTPSGGGLGDKASSKSIAAGPIINIPEGDYRIYPSIAPGSDLDDKDWKTSDGTVIQIWVNGLHQKNQWFHLTPLGNGEYWFAPQTDLAEAVTMLTPQNDGAIPTGLWAYSNNAAQIWVITSTPDGWCRLSPSNTPSLAMTVDGGLTKDGTPVTCAPWRGLRQQEWAIGIQ